MFGSPGAAIDELVGTEPPRLGVVRAAPHEALDAHDGVARDMCGQRAAARRPTTTSPLGRYETTLGTSTSLVAVRDGDGRSLLHVRDERVRRAEVDADGPRWRLGVEDFEEMSSMAASSSSMALTSSRKRR